MRDGRQVAVLPGLLAIDALGSLGPTLERIGHGVGYAGHENHFCVGPCDGGDEIRWYTHGICMIFQAREFTISHENMKWTFKCMWYSYTSCTIPFSWRTVTEHGHFV